MKILLFIPILVFYLIFTLFLMGLFFCSIYSRYARRRSHTAILFSERTKIDKYPDDAFYSLKYRSARVIINKVDLYLYGLCRYYSILIGRLPSQRIRNFLMRKCLCMDISPRAVLYGGFEIRTPWKIHIGESVIGVGALLDGRNGISIADRVCLAQNVKIFTVQHDVNDPHFAAWGQGVTLNEYSWISSGTTILPGITVGEGAVLASGAVATKNLEPYGVYAGIPAKKTSERNHTLNYETCHGYWHFY